MKHKCLDDINEEKKTREMCYPLLNASTRTETQGQKVRTTENQAKTTPTRTVNTLAQTTLLASSSWSRTEKKPPENIVCRF